MSGIVHGPYTTADARDFANGIAASEAHQAATQPRSSLERAAGSGLDRFSWQLQQFYVITGCVAHETHGYVAKDGRRKNADLVGTYVRKAHAATGPGDGVGIAHERIARSIREDADVGTGRAFEVYVIVLVHCDQQAT